MEIIQLFGYTMIPICIIISNQKNMLRLAISSFPKLNCLLQGEHILNFICYLSLTRAVSPSKTAWAAESLATGILKGEQLT